MSSISTSDSPVARAPSNETERSSVVVTGKALSLSQLLTQQPFRHQSREQRPEGCAAVGARPAVRT